MITTPLHPRSLASFAEPIHPEALVEPGRLAGFGMPLPLPDFPPEGSMDRILHCSELLCCTAHRRISRRLISTGCMALPIGLGPFQRMVLVFLFFVSSTCAVGPRASIICSAGLPPQAPGFVRHHATLHCVSVYLAAWLALPVYLPAAR